MEAWALAIGFGTLLVTVAGFGLALVMLVRSMRKSNEAAHAKTGQHIRDLDARNEAAHAGIVERIDSSRAEVLGQVRHLDAKNEAAHAGISERIDSSRAEALARADAHARKLDVVAHDVAFLAGRQKERDHRDGGGS